MPPLIYHQGQISIQEEAKTRYVADHLANWVGPVIDFALGADLVLLAAPDAEGILRFNVLSGAPPLVEVADADAARLRFPEVFSRGLREAQYGGLVINLSLARRARLNGRIRKPGAQAELAAAETFTLCRKYMAPSIAVERGPLVGPLARQPIGLDDPWLTSVLTRTETAFLASISPDGGPDVAHRGGPPGFITLDAARSAISWPEFVGDGVFKSAGNVRATGGFTLLALDLESGDGAELVGTGAYTNLRPERKARLDPLVRHKEPFPVQGVIEGSVAGAYRLTAVLHPRRRIEKALKITSASAVAEQAPQ
ncbi:MAG TPA: pyridoxamine 5'-phosphate oxidase family protein [Dehalococcoidia bacterium]|nr:pyridoxamine 5'-phosphate oxidase family protein [Dehalococcoidia bacterium]